MVLGDLAANEIEIGPDLRASIQLVYVNYLECEPELWKRYMQALLPRMDDSVFYLTREDTIEEPLRFDQFSELLRSLAQEWIETHATLRDTLRRTPATAAVKTLTLFVKRIVSTYNPQPINGQVRTYSAPIRKQKHRGETVEIGFKSRRPVRSVCVMNGPVKAAVIEERPGYIKVTEDTPLLKAEKHPFLSVTIYDCFSRSVLLEQLQQAPSFDILLSRILNLQLEIGPPETSGQHRGIKKLPLGRCWQIRRDNQRVGCVWDFPGVFAFLEWQPSEQEKPNQHFSACCYCSPESPMAERLLKCFNASNSSWELCSTLMKQGFQLTPAAYRSF